MRKTAAQPTSVPKPLAVLNTFLNPFATIMPGSSEFWMPKRIADPTYASSAKPTFPFTGHPAYDQLIFHAGALGTSGVVLTALIRLALGAGRREAAERKQQTALQATLAARRPVISPDPDLSDLAAEESERTLGVAKEAEGQIPTAWLKAMLPLSALIGGSVLGYQGVDRTMERMEATKAKRETAEMLNELDRLNYERLMRARGLDPETGLPKEAQGREPFSEALKALAALTMASAAISSGILVKRHFDEVDPARREAKEVDNVLRQLEYEEQRKAPIGVEPLPPGLRTKLNAHLYRKSQAAATARRQLRQPGLAALPAPVAPGLPEPAEAAPRLEAAPVDVDPLPVPRDLTDRTMAAL